MEEGESESESVIALSQNMLRPVLSALACCSAFTLDPWCVCTRVKKMQAGRRRNKKIVRHEIFAAIVIKDIDHIQSMCACSRVPGHPRHFWMTNCTTNRMGWVEPSVGGLLSYNQSPSVGLSRPLFATVSSGKRK